MIKILLKVFSVCVYSNARLHVHVCVSVCVRVPNSQKSVLCLMCTRVCVHEFLQCVNSVCLCAYMCLHVFLQFFFPINLSSLTDYSLQTEVKQTVVWVQESSTRCPSFLFLSSSQSAVEVPSFLTIVRCKRLSNLNLFINISHSMIDYWDHLIMPTLLVFKLACHLFKWIEPSCHSETAQRKDFDTQREHSHS